MVSCLFLRSINFGTIRSRITPQPLNPHPEKNCLGLVSTEGRILPELAWKGFDAIQIPPAQVSPNGGNLVLL